MTSGTTQEKATGTTQERRDDRGGNPITDGWITMKIHSQFVPDDQLEGSNIDVDTDHGVVALSGTVPSEASRARAVAIAKATDGVKSVTDNMRIGPAESALGMRGDTVRETGEAVSDAGQAAGRTAKDTARQTGQAVKDTGAAAGRTVTDGWIKSKIYAQFLTEDALDDSDIDIDVSRGVVTLNGFVKSAAGRTRAQAIAKATDGVKNVENKLTVNAGR
jgi:hyperosmotically inducible protein